VWAQTDTDADGVADYLDNCTNVANVTQIDTDGDYYGNRCDPDFNQDGYVTAADYVLFRRKLNTTDPLYDLNGDGYVTAADYVILRGYLNGPPGPSEPANGVMSSVTFDAGDLGLQPPEAKVADGLIISDWRRGDQYWTGVTAGTGVALQLDPRALGNPPATGVDLGFRKLTDPVTPWSAKWVDLWLLNTTAAALTATIMEYPLTCQGGAVNWQSFPGAVAVPANSAVMVHVYDGMCAALAVRNVRVSAPAGLVVDRVDFNLMP
jgi:hypothetical protein